MKWEISGPRLLFTVTFLYGGSTSRQVRRVNPFYTHSLWSIRRTAQTGTLVPLRLSLFGRDIPTPLLFQGIAGAGTVAETLWWLHSSQIPALGQGVLRQAIRSNPFGGFTNLRAFGNLLPTNLVLENSNQTAGGVPGSTVTVEVWATLIGPRIEGTQ